MHKLNGRFVRPTNVSAHISSNTQYIISEVERNEIHIVFSTSLC